MKCPNCGKAIANDSAYCEYCGAQIVPSSPKNKWLLPIVCIILGVAIGGAVMAYIKLASPSASFLSPNKEVPVDEVKEDTPIEEPQVYNINRHIFLSGSINGKYDVHMTLYISIVRPYTDTTVTHQYITGAYYYDNVEDKFNNYLILQQAGYYDKDHPFTLYEYDPDGKMTGCFDGSLQETSRTHDIIFIGTFTRFSDGKTMPFQLYSRPYNDGSFLEF